MKWGMRKLLYFGLCIAVFAVFVGCDKDLKREEISSTEGTSISRSDKFEAVGADSTVETKDSCGGNSTSPYTSVTF